ncbi:hypothetical protein CUR178_03581 [Leishmania enriettii]|uniref:Uncharacterized protein n=1 Tax=Leishmania enriettii TaxID=5663 RepID=A0A836KRT3_LEIEN|nr:hypothetical protein CUR178_03581 [Leishmania enriettii]
MFDPTWSKGNINERVSECSMRVVQYAFEERERGATETMLLDGRGDGVSNGEADPGVDGAAVAAAHRESPRHPPLSTGPEHQLRGAGQHHPHVPRLRGRVLSHFHIDKKKSTCDLGRVRVKTYQQPCGGGTAWEGTRVIVARTDEEVLGFLPDVLWRVIAAAAKTCQSEVMKPRIAFLTGTRQRDEVCCALPWLQKNSRVSLPPYHVCTVASTLGEDWEEHVAGELTHFCYGTHSCLMTNEYGSICHCCESTVSAMALVIDTAVRQLHLG